MLETLGGVGSEHVQGDRKGWFICVCVCVLVKTRKQTERERAEKYSKKGDIKPDTHEAQGVSLL